MRFDIPPASATQKEAPVLTAHSNQQEKENAMRITRHMWARFPNSNLPSVDLPDGTIDNLLIPPNTHVIEIWEAYRVTAADGNLLGDVSQEKLIGRVILGATTTRTPEGNNYAQLPGTLGRLSLRDNDIFIPAFAEPPAPSPPTKRKK